MIPNLPIYISIVFLATTGLGVYLFMESQPKNTDLLILVLVWGIIQWMISRGGFYLDTNAIPPRFLLAILPPFIVLCYWLFSPNNASFLEKFDLKMLTWFHLVRIPVEVVLYWLWMWGQVPEFMTFKAGNWDILSGLSAPLIAYYGFHKKTLSNKTILYWNIICLVLVLNVVIRGILSAPLPFQVFGFEHPNRAVLLFPFVWLPSIIVPMVIFSHALTIKRLWPVRNS